jgi:hypothetical protein
MEQFKQLARLPLSQRLSSAREAWRRIGALNLLERGVTPEWKDMEMVEALTRRPWPPTFRGTVEQTALYRQLLAEELRLEVVRRILRRDVKWCNPTFVILKKTGQGRKILDCSILNRCLVDRSFKMEDARTVCQLAEAGDWAATLDISSAYLHVTVQAELQPYLAFSFDGQYYCYTMMPFGLKSAPRIFTLLMRHVIDDLRQQWNLRCVIYMDDLLILSSTKEVATLATMNTAVHLLSLGWTIRWEKCQLVPCQTIEFVGWLFDFQSMTLRTTHNRRRELLTLSRSLLTIAQCRERIPVKKLASFLGSLNFLRLQVEATSLYTSMMNRIKTRAVKTAGWRAQARLTPVLRGELKWWIKTLTHNTPHQL